MPASTTMMVPFAAECHHVHAEFAEPAERNNFESIISLFTTDYTHVRNCSTDSSSGARVDVQLRRCLRFAPGFRRGPGTEYAQQIVDQFLAARGKCVVDEVGEWPGVGDAGLPVEADDRGVDFRRRRERAGRNGETLRRASRSTGSEPKADRSRAVPGFARKPLGDFLLEHDRDIENAGAVVDESFEAAAWRRCREGCRRGEMGRR